uniref:Uncharacterized protein n=1 Tax=Pristionchus pacificus TaxID=54126 RepID=A0A2A6BTR0_PRIPA|eukprot:PDM69319.1 hypothetical protein PRIPAC_47621 [Pristionchus pacificus]
MYSHARDTPRTPSPAPPSAPFCSWTIVARTRMTYASEGTSMSPGGSTRGDRLDGAEREDDVRKEDEEEAADWKYHD